MTWEPVAIVASLWLAAGMTFANILYRRGHGGRHWILVCAVAGPLAALVVADQRSRSARSAVVPSISCLTRQDQN